MADQVKPPAEYFIWSVEHDAWWKPNEHGYTTLLLDAGIYTFDDAIRICRSANSRMNRMPMEAMVPVFALAEKGG